MDGVSILEPIRQSTGKLRLIMASQGAAHGISNDAQVVELTFRANVFTENKTGTMTISKAVLGDAEGAKRKRQLLATALRLRPRFLAFLVILRTI